MGPSLCQPTDTSTLDFRLQNSGTPDCCCGLPPNLRPYVHGRQGVRRSLGKTEEQEQKQS